jgi:hypothetical protein
MSKKAGIGIGIGVVLLILIAWVGMTVSAVSGESSKADDFLKDAVASHMPQAELSQKLKDMGFEMTDSKGSSTGTGPTHSLVVYSTHLTVNLTFDQDGKANSYHLDKG